MALTYDDRFPFLDSAGRKRLLERAMACAGPIAERLKVPEAAVRNARLLGCGNYGCTLLIEGLPRDKAVLKITSDNMEANAALQIVDDYTAHQEDGLLKIEQVFQLGKCSVLPGISRCRRTLCPKLTTRSPSPAMIVTGTAISPKHARARAA